MEVRSFIALFARKYQMSFRSLIMFSMVSDILYTIAIDDYVFGRSLFFHCVVGSCVSVKDV